MPRLVATVCPSWSRTYLARCPKSVPPQASSRAFTRAFYFWRVSFLTVHHRRAANRLQSSSERNFSSSTVAIADAPRAAAAFNPSMVSCLNKAGGKHRHRMRGGRRKASPSVSDWMTTSTEENAVRVGRDPRLSETEGVAAVPAARLGDFRVEGGEERRGVALLRLSPAVQWLKLGG